MVDQHPSMDIIGSSGNTLAGKKIVLAMCGSVGAVRCVDIARLLMRQGAQVYPVMTQAATELIAPELMEWATGNKVVTRISGAIEHVALAGNVPDNCDMVLVAPATANTVSKIACGIDDTPVTTVVTTALGQRIPVLIVPAMHEPMYRHPIVGRNIASLNDAGIPVFVPPVSEGKAKIPSAENVAAMVRVLMAFGGARPLSGKRVLVTAGRTIEYLDPIRVVSNNSSGRMGIALAQAASALGAEVTLVLGKYAAALPDDVRIRHTESTQEMLDAVQEELQASQVDVCLAAAAVNDWQAAAPADHKVSTHSGNPYTIELEPTPKIIDGIKAVSPETFLVAFRAQSGFTAEQLRADALQRMKKAQADAIVANDVSAPGAGFESATNAVTLVHSDGSHTELPLAEKLDIAIGIWQQLIPHLPVRK